MSPRASACRTDRDRVLQKQNVGRVDVRIDDLLDLEGGENVTPPLGPSLSALARRVVDGHLRGLIPSEEVRLSRGYLEAVEENERLRAVEALDPESWAERESRIAWQDRLEREYKAKLERMDAALRGLYGFIDAQEWGGPFVGRPHAEMDAARAALSSPSKPSDAGSVAT